MTDIIHQAQKAMKEARAQLPRARPLMSALFDEQSKLRAANYDPSTRDATLYCLTHERDLTDCRRAELLCTGVPVDDHSDPTGEAAIIGDRARQDERTAVDHLRQAAHHLRKFGEIAGLYLDAKPVALEALADENLARCESCARVPRDKGAKGKNAPRWSVPPDRRSDCKGMLPRVMALCRWCAEWTLDPAKGNGELPSRRLVEQHRDNQLTGSRIYVDASTDARHA